MTKAITLEIDVHFRNRGRGNRRELRPGPTPPSPKLEPGRVSRVARLTALAIRFQELLRSGQVASYAELAELGHVSRARVTQIMNLLLLAPDIQEQILFCPELCRARRHPSAATAADRLDC